MSHRSSPARAYDFLLKFLLVGDSDVGKGEILASLQDGASESPYGYNMGVMMGDGDITVVGCPSAREFSGETAA
ncbi:hypothetical protein PAMP_009881 [Pampus punctatissimus]